MENPLKNPLPKEGLFPMKAILITCIDPTKFLHDESGPLPSSPDLNAIPILIFNQCICIREAKYTMLRNEC
jgi:hypothetical protein